MSTRLSPEELEARIKLVDEHVQAEVERDLDAIMRTWGANPSFLMARFSPEIAAPGVPVWLQRPLWHLLARVARLRGYPSSFPEYGVP
jgi:hypothetical protein